MPPVLVYHLLPLGCRALFPGVNALQSLHLPKFRPGLRLTCRRVNLTVTSYVRYLSFGPCRFDARWLAQVELCLHASTLWTPTWDAISP